MSNTRESVKNIKSSQARRENFEELAVQMGISLEKQPTLDIYIRWNSIYLMLQSAYQFKTVFDELGKQDKSFITAPTLAEWIRSKAAREFLKTFYDATNQLFHRGHGWLERGVKREIGIREDHIKPYGQPQWRGVHAGATRESLLQSRPH